MHYLALCAGAEGGTATEFFRHFECVRKPVGWVFRTDDPFITNFGTFNGSSAVNSNRELIQIETIKPGVMLVIGLVLSILALLASLLDILKFSGRRSGSGISTAAIALLGVCFFELQK